MSYYSTAFKDICSDSHGEAMQTRLYVRLNDGSNLFSASNDLDDASWTAHSDLSVITTSLVDNIPEFGDIHQVIQTSSTSTEASIYFDEVGFDYGWWVLSAVVRQLGIDANQGVVALMVEDTTVGSSTQQIAQFEFAAGVCSHYGSDTDVLASGIVDLGNGLYHIWAAGQTEGGGGSVGNDYRFSILPNYGVSTAGQGVYIGNMDLDIARSGDAKASEGARAPVLTTGTAIPYGGAPGSLIAVHDTEKTISANPVNVKREYQFGVVESQQWQVKVTHFQLALMANELSGCFIALECGFPIADEWALISQGRIATAEATTDLEVTIDVDDPLRQVLDGELARDVNFDTVSWGSEIYSEAVADGSASYDNEATGAGITISSDAFTPEATWKIIFTSATAFKVVRDDGTEYTGYTKSSDATVTIGVAAFVIHYEGWDAGTDTYASGDTFVFYTSNLRATSNALTPISIIQEFVTSDLFLNVRVLDVKAGIYYDSPLYDKAASWDAAIANYDTTTLKGIHLSSTRVIKLIQQILQIIHGSIYSMPTGQLALWEAQPNETEPVNLNGDFGSGEVNIMSGSLTDDQEEVFNVVRYDYLTLSDGAEAQYTDRDENARVITDRTKVITINWKVDSGSINAAASKAILRYKANRRKMTIQTTLVGAAIDLDQPIAANEPLLSVNSKSLVVERSVEVMENAASLTLSLDDFTLGDYMKVTDKFGNVPGEGIDEGNKVAPTGGPYTGLRKVF